MGKRSFHCDGVLAGVSRTHFDFFFGGRGGVSIELPEYAILIKLHEFSFLNFLFIKLPETSFLHCRHLICWCFSTKKSSAFVKLKKRYSRFSIKPK